ncbi:hypothetical protein EMIT0P44_60203 [Pseudomonas sp. IT-P44]
MPTHMGVVERFSTAGRERGRAVLRGGGVLSGLTPSRASLAPTGNAPFTNTANGAFDGVRNIANAPLPVGARLAREER